MKKKQNLIKKSNLFSNLTFVIIPYSHDLTSKRKDVIEDIIQSHSGLIITLENFVLNKEIPNYIICSNDVKYEYLSKLFNKDQDFVDKLVLLNPKFISDSIKSNSIQLDVSEYIIKPIVENLIKLKSNLSSNTYNSIDLLSNEVVNKTHIQEAVLANFTNLSQNDSKSSITNTLSTNNIKKKRFVPKVINSRLFEVIDNQQLKESNKSLQKKEEIISFNQDNICQDSIKLLKFKSDEESKENNKLLTFIDNLKSKRKSNENLMEINSYDTLSDISSTSYSKDSSLSSSLKSLSSNIHKPNHKNYQFYKLKSQDNIEEKEEDNQSQNSQFDYKELITTELEKMLNYHTNEKNTFESLAYRKAINLIKNMKEKITSFDKIKKIKNLGKNIKNRIKEIISTGKLNKTDSLTDVKKNEILQILTGVHGIGINTAIKLYLKNIHSINDLRNNQHLLTNVQKIGLKYYEDIIKRIPRDECNVVLKIIQSSLFSIISETIVLSEICGSYRRGKETVGDIDILITRTDDGLIDGILQTLIDDLYKKEFVIETLSMNNYLSTNSTFLGICKVNGTHRRVDIKIYNKKCYPFALLYFTGSAYFNRSMRLYASKLGLSLSDHGFNLNNKVIVDKLIKEKMNACNNEEDIFHLLGVEFIPPAQRDI